MAIYGEEVNDTVENQSLSSHRCAIFLEISKVSALGFAIPGVDIPSEMAPALGGG